MKDTIYFKKWGKNKVAFIMGGAVYEEHAVKDVNEKTLEEIKEYLVTVYAINPEDELVEIQ